MASGASQAASGPIQWCPSSLLTLTQYELGHDAAHAPHVQGRAVLLLTQQPVNGAVPQRDDLGRYGGGTAVWTARSPSGTAPDAVTNWGVGGRWAWWAASRPSTSRWRSGPGTPPWPPSAETRSSGSRLPPNGRRWRRKGRAKDRHLTTRRVDGPQQSRARCHSTTRSGQRRLLERLLLDVRWDSYALLQRLQR